MTDLPRQNDDPATLRAAIDSLAARIDRIEARAAPSAHDGRQDGAADSARDRLSGAWHALRGGDASGPATAGRRGMLVPLLTICAAFLALILAVELADGLGDALGHIGRWLD